MNNRKAYQQKYDGLAYSAEQKKAIAARAAAAAAEAQMHSHRRNYHIFSKFAAAAACLLCAVTITAEAAGITTPISGLLAPIFGSTVSQTEVIDKIGRPIEASDTDNGVTISAEAIIGDAYNACFVFRISRDDGTALLPEGMTARNLRLGGFCDISTGKHGGTHGSAGFVDPVPGDNEILYTHVLCSDNPLNKGSVKAVFEDIAYWDEETGEEVPLVEGKWSIRFAVDYEDASVVLGNGETFSQEGMNFTITEIRLSPVAVQVSYEVDSEVQWSNGPSGELPEEDRRQVERYLENIEVLLVKKDGTVVDVSSSGGSIKPENGKTLCVKSRILDEVIPMEEMESIRVGGVEFVIAE